MSRAIGVFSIAQWVRHLIGVLLLMALGACGGGGGSAAPAAPVITQQPASVSVPAGATATFSVGLQDAAGAAYQWLRDGVAVAGATQPSHAVPSTTTAMSGSKWSVVVSNPAGTVTSAEAVLTVTVPPGISLVVPKLGDALDLAIDAQGNTIAVLQKSTATLAVVARKFAPDGSELPYGPDGQGMPLPGAAPNINAFGPRYTGAAFAESGDIYVSTVTLNGVTFNTFAADGGRLSRVAPDGQITVLTDWPAGSAGAVAPASVTLGPDGALYFVDYISGHLMKRSSAGVVSSVGDVQVKPAGFFGVSRYSWIAVESADLAYVIKNVLTTSVPSSSPRSLMRVQAGVVTVLAGNAGVGNAVDGTGTAASFGSPSGVALGGDGTLYVADGTLLRKVTRAGVVTTVAGQPGSDVLVPGPLPGSLGNLGALAIGRDGVIQVISNAAAPPQRDYALVKIRLQ